MNSISIVFSRLFSLLSIVTLTFDPWPKKINRVHSLILGNICDKFDQNILKGFSSGVFTKLYTLYTVTLTFDLWPPKSLGFILPLWLTCLSKLMNTHNSSASIVFTSFKCDRLTDRHTDWATEVLLYVCYALQRDKKMLTQISRALQYCKPKCQKSLKHNCHVQI